MFFIRVFFVLNILMLPISSVDRKNTSKQYVLDNVKQLKKMVNKKKSTKPVAKLDVLFDEYAEDAKELLDSIEENKDNNNQSDFQKKEMVMQIANHMAVLQKLLTMMSNTQPESLTIYCRDQSGDTLWQNLCSNRPSKKIQKPDEFIKTKEHLKDEPNSIKIRYINATEDELIDPKLGN